MPLPNEHSARLQDPKKFNPATFKRTKGGIIYGSKKVPSTISIIWGKIRGRDKPADSPIPQSLRFPTKNYTAVQAKAWLKKNNIKYIRFEAASKGKQSELAEKYKCECIECGHKLESSKHCSDIKCSKCGGQMRREERPGPGKKENFIDVPKSALTFRQEDIPIKVELAKREDGATRRRFKMVAHTFKIMDNRGWFGDLVIDREGLKIGRKDKPVLLEHDSLKIVGHTDKINLDEKEGLIAEGFLTDKTEEGARVIGLLDDEYPWQASIYVPPRGREAIQRVDEGKSEKVNGYVFKGPGYILRQTYLREFSFCSMGADENTHANALSNGEKIRLYLDSPDGGSDNQTSLKGDEDMDIMKLTIEELKEKRQDLVEAVLADADPDPNPSEEDTPADDKPSDDKPADDKPADDKPADGDSKEAMKIKKIERERVSAILSESEGFKEVKGFNDEVKKLINDGTSEKDALLKLKDLKLEAMQKGQVPNLGPSSEPKPTLVGEDPDGSKHLARAKEYASANKCGITEALQATVIEKPKDQK